MKIPDIQTYDDGRTFLKDVYELNKAKNASFRFYASKLKWPVSYLNEVIQGRKKLSLARALEFGLFLKLDSVDLERLVFLALKDSETPNIQSYFNKKISEEVKTTGYFHVSAQPESTADEPVVVVPKDVYSDISLLAIFDTITWAQGRIRPSEISKLLYTFNSLENRDVLAMKLKVLEDHGYITQLRDPDQNVIGFDFIRKQLRFSVTRETAPLMAQYADNYVRFLNHSRSRGWFASGFVKIPRNRLSAVKKRVMSLRNWLMEIDREVLENPKEREDALVFQTDVNLFCLIDGEELGLPRLNDWMIEES